MKVMCTFDMIGCEIHTGIEIYVQIKRHPEAPTIPLCLQPMLGSHIQPRYIIITHSTKIHNYVIYINSIISLIYATCAASRWQSGPTSARVMSYECFIPESSAIVFQYHPIYYIAPRDMNNQKYSEGQRYSNKSLVPSTATSSYPGSEWQGNSLHGTLCCYPGLEYRDTVLTTWYLALLFCNIPAL